MGWGVGVGKTEIQGKQKTISACCYAFCNTQGHLPYRKVQRSVASLNLVFECYIISRPRLRAITFTSDGLTSIKLDNHNHINEDRYAYDGSLVEP